MGAPGRPEIMSSSRFEIRRRLGAGAYGVVFEAEDRERGTLIALKVLGRNDPLALYRFKQEFRSLTGFVHPNLVALYELLVEQDQWFFTMELVRGVDFLQHVWRSGAEAKPWAPTDAGALADASTDSGEFASPSHSAPIAMPDSAGELATVPTALWADVDRLRVALRQLGEGLSALHGAGKLHRDIKPSNVLVDTQGCVKILDFGLVQEMESLARPVGTIAGTSAYMAPELVAGEPIAAAADWYSVGVLLYQALTGQLPFNGSPEEIRASKQTRDPVPPCQLVTDIPPALDQLCRALLRRRPGDRPSWPAMARALGSFTTLVDVETRPATEACDPRVRRAERIIRRESLLGELRSAFDRVSEGGTVLVSLFGRSGMGKTTLVRQFLNELRAEGPVVVLEGCCYSQETVPYKALDGIVDGLSQYLRTLPASEVAALLPPDAPALARLFPVMQQVQRIAPAQAPALSGPDDQELRARGVRVLREILARLAARQRVVLFIDDLQWGDLDSASLIGELVAAPAPPNVLWIAAYRSEDSDTSPILRRMLAWKGRIPAGSRLIELPVGELSQEQSRRLASILLGEDGDAARSAESIALESGGSPFFIAELAHGLQAVPGTAHSAAVEAPGQVASLDRFIQDRVARLDGDERRLLEVVSIAGQPTERRIVAAAARITQDEPAVLARLRAGHLLRNAATAGADCLEAYHDRIREAVVAQLGAQQVRAYHAALAAAMEAQTTPDPERLTVHFHAAGDTEKAARYAIDAAARASAALAFDRAARLYRMVLDHLPSDEPRARDIHFKLAESLANAGRSRDAATAYLELAEAAGHRYPGALELRRRAAEQLLRGGYLAEGIKAIRGVLASVGWKLPTNRRSALVRLLLRRAHLRLRGLGFRRRSEAEISSRVLARIDSCWSVATGLGFVDPTLGGLLQARHLLWALEAGEPYRIARALALEAAYSSIGGGRTRVRTEQLVTASLTLARAQANPHALALASETAGIAAAFEGRWKAADALLADAETMLRERCAGVVYELDNALYWRLFALAHRGHWRELQGRVPGAQKDASERGDLYLGTNLKLRVAFIAALAAGDPEGAARELDEAMAQWAFTGFSNQHWWELLGRVQICLYRGRAADAWEALASRWAAVSRSFVLRIQLVKILALDLRARAALAAAEAGDLRPGRLLRVAETCARSLATERMPWSQPLADRLQAAVDSLAGDPDGAAALLRRSAAGFRAADMELHAAIAERCLGQLIGGTDGNALVAAADAWMTGQNVREPDRIARMIAPGRWLSRTRASSRATE